MRTNFQKRLLLFFFSITIFFAEVITPNALAQQRQEDGKERLVLEPPKITSFIPERTAREKLKIEGKTCPNCNVVIEINESRVEASGGADGKFGAEVKLEKNKKNILRIYSLSGKASSDFIEYSITHADLPLPKNLNEPPSVDKNSIPPYTREASVVIFGRALPLMKVVARGGSSPASSMSDKDGYFELLVFLNFDTLNEIEIYMEDEKGFLSPREKVEIYQISKAPPAPRLYDAPAATNLEKVSLKGKTIPTMKVLAELKGGRKFETVATKKGEFVIDVLLVRNSENEISLFTVDPAGNISAPTRLKIIQDSSPPPPPIIESYPSKVVENKATISGRGEADAKIIAKISDTEKVVGTVGKTGDFVVDVEVLKYERQLRRNYIHIILEDKAGNRSEPALIIIDRLPDIRKFVVDAGISFHTFHNFVGNEFFEKTAETSPYKFWGFGLEVEPIYIFQRRSGLALGLVLGGYLPVSQKIESIVSSEVQATEEINELTLTKLFIALSPKAVFFAENFDLFFGIDIGTIFLIKKAPELTAEGRWEMVKRLFIPLMLRLSGKIKYFLNPAIALFFSPSVGYAPIKNANEFGHTLDAGGVSTTFGVSFNLF
ncbi:MAG: Ig-like domain-containing protein [Candidatus Calescibacterium sp.]